MHEKKRISTTNQPRLAILAPTLGGGIGKVLVNLLNHLAGCGLSIDLLLVKTSNPFVKALDSEINIIKLRTTNMLGGIPGLVAYLHRNKPVALMTESMRSNALAIRAKNLSGCPTKIFASIHNTYSMALASRDPHKKMRLLKRMKTYLPKNDGIIAVSKGVASDLVKLLDLPPERVRVIYNPVITPEMEHLSQQHPNHDWFKDSTIPVIMSAGRLHPQKDYPTLLQAFRIVSNQLPCRLFILGEGEEKTNLERLARELNISERVEFADFTHNPYQYMRCADVFVLSSRWEGFGNVLAEALGVGCPVISTDCPNGPREILHDGRYGQLVPVGDSDTLAKAILQALESELDHEFTKEASARFNVKDVASEYLKYFGISQ